MKKNIMVLVEKEWNNKQILHPEEVEIETNNVNLVSNGQKSIGYDGKLLKLTRNSFKDLKKELIRSKIYERIMVL